MKVIRSEDKIFLAQQLWDVIQQRRELEKEEKRLKAIFAEDLKESNIIKAGNIIIIGNEVSKRFLDRQKLVDVYGERRVMEFEYVTNYLQMDVRKDRSMEIES